MNYRRYSSITMRAIQKSSRKDIIIYGLPRERIFYFRDPRNGDGGKGDDDENLKGIMRRHCAVISSR